MAQQTNQAKKKSTDTKSYQHIGINTSLLSWKSIYFLEQMMSRDKYLSLLYGWELTKSRIWLAEIDIDRGLDFPT